MKIILKILLLLSFIPGWSKTYVVSVGVRNYADKNISECWFTDNDAIDISHFYKDKNSDVITLTNKSATKESIMRAMKSKFLNANENDRILFFYSGHGFEGGFTPFDANPEDYYSFLFYKDIIEIMEKSSAKDKFIFSNACHSGTIRNKKNFTLPQKCNILMFLASRSGEYSLEYSDLKNSTFTHFLLQALKGKADSNNDKKITAVELFDYVNREVQLRTQGIQHPVMWGIFPKELIIVEL